MKSYIRTILDDLQHNKADKDFIPQPPKAPYLDPSPATALPGDLENQDLSIDPKSA